MFLKATIFLILMLVSSQIERAGAQGLKQSNFMELLNAGTKGGGAGSGGPSGSGGSGGSASPPTTGGSPQGGPTAPGAVASPTPTPAASGGTGGLATPSGTKLGGSSAPSATPSGASTPSGGGGTGSGQAPTFEQFVEAVNAYSLTSAGGTPPKPSQDIYNAYVKNVASKMSLKEQAMFLANSIWETGGLQHMKEIACSSGSCTYGKYYGRGFMQLTWDYNYKAASTALYNDDRLVTNPDLAAEPDGAWATATWFWTSQVRPALQSTNAVDNYQLGYAVKKINGALECPANDKANNRLKIYNQILKAWNVAGNSPGTLAGC